MSAILSVQGLSVQFGALKAVHDVSFEAHPGRITAVIAVRGADPVLNKEDFERDLKAATANLDGQAKADALITLQPANQARNHDASPVVPKAP